MARAHQAIASAFRRLPNVRRLDRQALAGHARLFIHPAYARLVRAEPLIRRLIPFLIVLFIVTLGMMRIVVLSDARGDIENKAKLTLGLLAGAIATNLEEMRGQMPATAMSETYHGILANALPPGAEDSGRVTVLADPLGKIVAVDPYAVELVGRSLDDLLGPGQPLTTLGERAGVLSIRLPDGNDVLATVHHIGEATGSVAIYQPLSSVFANWRSQVSREATVFVGTSIILSILGFAYQAQTTRAEEADYIYSETQNRVHMALMRGRSGLWDWDLSRGAIFWSPSMYDIVGLPALNNLLSAGEVSSRIHPEDGDLIEMANALIQAEGAQIDREFRMRHESGRWIWVRVRGEVVRDADGPHWIGIAVDVTESKLAAEASRTADLRLHDAVEAISEAFVLWDASNRLVLCNSKYQELYQLPDNLVRPGTAYADVVASGRRPQFASLLPAAESPQLGGRSVEARIEDGRWLQINERRTKDGGFVSVGTDITALKQHEAQLLENERKLTATVADLRGSRQQLEKQAQQLVELAEKYALEKEHAEELSRVKSEFMANVSHELRTPLNAIIGFSEMMQSGAFGPLGNEKYEEYCADIRDSGGYLLSVISDILDMTRLESGHISLDPSEVDLAELAEEVVASLSKEAAESNIDIRLDVEKDFRLDADRKALRQALLAVVSNGVKFTPTDGKVKISVRRRGGEALIAVEDTGIGIPKKALERLGRPFEQVARQMTRDHKGSGLGLAITQSIVQLHGGAMRIDSSEGVGTRVTLSLPLHQQTANAA
ncbi:PAS domain-containing sensor histidine kinase [Afifella marina DSM 2698]|uniref:histidine kinase n=3 Tax=Hyphomicrobiales TaxID=356 RepID=A0A1G5MJ03_AFIMA|nr:ATP-binding protein [Afifella marina]MBK1625399.1 PAS domain-containing sensor histidine kinase [Afifella marina DSM 2698]MBK1628986.1 PAS domain-containing sensor histidine kinase [Afifella marina]MBK5916942.1 PAS domain-containing sensor histidine kinase [Afifella marina]RAI22766.1 PAS domain-containing sensor histidine kinase [Afifella marina DSM 2698]SCZ24489.1 two-component system, cell cycle sensor histidine kinase PleC [Afifella marina DSM 2698]